MTCLMFVNYGSEWFNSLGIDFCIHKMLGYMKLYAHIACTNPSFKQEDSIFDIEQ